MTEKTNKLLIVSNRLPLTVSKSEQGLDLRESIGGLATGLSSVFSDRNGRWMGWPGLPDEVLNESEKQEINERFREKQFEPVFLSENQLTRYYEGFCNNTIWPLFHYFQQFVRYKTTDWEAYQEVNLQFAERAAEVVEPGDSVWIQDYHFLLLPTLLRERVPGLSIGFFLHIPFPSYEIFRVLPWRTELLSGLLGADLIGFHTFSYAQHFLESVRRILGFDNRLGVIQTDERMVKADAFPMGIDYQRYAEGGDRADVQAEIKNLRQEVGDRRIIFSVDRLDYTKGIPERLHAFDAFLTRYPEYKGKVSLIQVTAPSRTAVDEYQNLKKHVDELVGDINGRHAQVGYVPVWYLYQTQSFAPLRALYEIADVALLTPLRDGMNLVAKEFVASKHASGQGVLVLSEFTGAASELVEALVVNPHDAGQIADALRDALQMPIYEQIERNKTMQSRLGRYNVRQWALDFIENLSQIDRLELPLSVCPLPDEVRADLIQRYANGDSRLLLLDYDGTLVGFTGKPEDAKPDQELLELLTALADTSGNQVVVISGRSKTDLDEWLGHLDLALVAEHGVWLRLPGEEWTTIVPMDDAWKEQIRPILSRFVDRTPGSQIEEKSFALAWHYRRVNRDLAEVRSQELKETLLQLTANMELAVLDGDEVLEVKHTGVDKGRAAAHWLTDRAWDFILALGDDSTDEDTFAALPADAYSIRVRYNPSRAQYNIRDHNAVRSLLRDLNGSDSNNHSSPGG